MTTNSLNKATLIAQKLTGGSDFYRDEDASKNAGYSIFRSVDNENNYYCIISETHVEANFNNQTATIWVEYDALEPIEIAKKMIDMQFTGKVIYDSYASARLGKPVYRQLTLANNFIASENKTIEINSIDSNRCFKVISNVEAVINAYNELIAE